jgi:hypothetical protein
MSILNSLTLLEEGHEEGFAPGELVTLARRNAEKLSAALSALLDVAEVEKGLLRLSLREVDLERVAHDRVRLQAASLRDRGLGAVWISGGVETSVSRTVLADPQKLARLVDLGLGLLAERAQRGSDLELEVGARSLALSAELQAGQGARLRAAWDEAQDEAEDAARQGKLSAGRAGAAFRGTRQTEREFLTRDEEGLGSGWVLLLDWMKLHEGTVSLDLTSPHRARLRFEFPEVTSEKALTSILASRAYRSTHDLSAVALGLIEVPKGLSVPEFQARVQSQLFRASDSVYALPKTHRVAVVLDDCKPEDAPGLMGRIRDRLGQPLKMGVACCPSEGLDPSYLLELAGRRLS